MAKYFDSDGNIAFCKLCKMFFQYIEEQSEVFYKFERKETKLKTVTKVNYIIMEYKFRQP